MSSRPDGRPDAGTAPVLSRSTLMTVRRVLHAYREGWLLDQRLAAAARMAAEDARLRGLGAERLLVALKREWAALDGIRCLDARDARTLLDRLVSLSIRAYYQPSPGDRRAGVHGTPDGRVDARPAA